MWQKIIYYLQLLSMESIMSGQHFDQLTTTMGNQYLRILGLEHCDPCYEELEKLVYAHVTKIPFENISKLYYKRNIGLHTLIDINRHLDGIEYQNLGGTCYANNYYFYLLLKYLGYDVIFCGADMDSPDVHVLIIVTIDRQEFLLDGGYGSPFIMPIPLGLNKDFILTHGQERYHFKPRDKNNKIKLEYYLNDELSHGYMVKPIDRKIEYFNEVIQSSFNDKSSFMNKFTLVCFGQDSSVSIRNFNLIEVKDNLVKIRKLQNREELMQTAYDLFSIKREFVSDVIDELALRNEQWELFK